MDQPSLETRIAVVETQVENLRDGHNEMAGDIRKMSDEVTALKVVIARWGGGLMVVNALVIIGSRYLPAG